MKNQRLPIFAMTIILFSMYFIPEINAMENSTINATGDGNNYQNPEIPQSKIMVLIPKSTYVTGEIIQINGSFHPNTLIRIDLINPLGHTRNSTQTYSDNTGHFHTNVMIPSYNSINGTWKIVTTSGFSHKSLDVMVTSNLAMQYSPLVQFKTVHDIEKITCSTGLVKIIKSEDGSPACVKSGTSKILVERGWAKSTQ